MCFLDRVVFFSCLMVKPFPKQSRWDPAQESCSDSFSQPSQDAIDSKATLCVLTRLNYRCKIGLCHSDWQGAFRGARKKRAFVEVQPCNTRLGFNTPAGSNRLLSRCINAISATVRLMFNQAIFSVPIPCSADTDP